MYSSFMINSSQNLFFVISGKDPTLSPGGYAAYAHNLCRVLKRLGYDVHIIAAGRKNIKRTTPMGTLHLVSNSLANIFPVLGSIEMAMMPAYAYSFAKHMNQIILQKNPEKFFVWGMGPWAFAGSILSLIYHKNMSLFMSYFTTFRHEMQGAYLSLTPGDYSVFIRIKYWLNLYIVGFLFGLIERFTLRRATSIITHYKSTEDILHSQFATPRNKMKRLSYYIDVFDRERKPDLEVKRFLKQISTPIVLTVCRQDPRKGLNFLLHAYHILEEKKIRFSALIVGSGALLEANKKLASKLNLQNVHFLGFQPSIDIFYKSASLVVLPSVEEGSGSLSVLEAMRYGLPIVTTDCDGIPEDIQHNDSALLVPPYNASSLAQSIQLLLHNKRKAAVLGKNAYAAYRNKFSFDTMTRDVNQLLSSHETT